MEPISTSRRQIQIRTSLEIADSIRFVEKALLNLLSHYRSSRDFSSANELSRITFNILQTNRRIFVNNIRQTDHLVEPIFDGSVPRPPFFRPPMAKLKKIINACQWYSKQQLFLTWRNGRRFRVQCSTSIERLCNSCTDDWRRKFLEPGNRLDFSYCLRKFLKKKKRNDRLSLLIFK